MIGKLELIELNKKLTCAEISRKTGYSHKQVTAMFVKYGITMNKHKYTISKDYLYELHITKSLNLNAMKRVLNIDTTTIRRLLKQHNIEYVNHKSTPIDMSTLTEMYSNNFKMAEISSKLGRSVSYIMKYIKKHKLTRLDKLHGFTKDVAIELYLTKNLSIIDIANLYGVSSCRVKELILSFDIGMKMDIEILDKESIESCLSENMTLESMSSELNCTLHTLKVNMNNYGLVASKYSKYKIPKSDIVKYHHIDKMSLSDVSKLYGCHKTTMSNLCNSYGIDIKRHFTTSNHRKVKELLDSLGIRYLDNCRNIIKPLELDIYIPEHNLAIEFNGVYWHSENFVDKNYHYNKYMKCKDIGIELIQIWEDDFNINEPKILKFIKYKLGFNAGKVFARKCIIANVNKNTSNEFHDTYHIQGKCPTSFNIGLESNGELVAVCSFKRTGNTLDLVRYSTSINVVGGFTKILSYVIKNIDFNEIITFADLCHSNGNLYNISGFVVDKILPPDYKYVVGGSRKHKFGYRKKAFKNNPNLLYEPNLTERELAKLNGLYRVYDAGKIRYKLVKE